MTAPGKALEALFALEVREAQAAELRHALARSLALEGLWPGVFQIEGPHKVRSHWTGGNGGRRLRFTVTAPDDSTREFARPQVPEILRNPKAEADAREILRRTPLALARFNQGLI